MAAPPDLIGDQLADQYAHLTTALAGHTGVSGVLLFRRQFGAGHRGGRSRSTHRADVVCSSGASPRHRLARHLLQYRHPACRPCLSDRRQGRRHHLGRIDHDVRVAPFTHEGGAPRPRSAGRFVRTRGGHGAPTFPRSRRRNTLAHRPRHPSADLVQGGRGVITGRLGALHARPRQRPDRLLLLSRLARARSLTATARLDALTQLPNRRAAEHVHDTASTATRRFATLWRVDDRHQPIQEHQ